MMDFTDTAREKNSSDPYIDRGEEEEEFIEKIISSLSHNGEETEKNKPFLFFIDGIAGIGKRRLVNKIQDKIEQNYKKNDEQIVIRESFNRINKLEDLLELMDSIYNQINKDEDSNNIEEQKGKHQEEIPEEFSKALKKYRDLTNKLKLEPIIGEDTVSGEQKENADLILKVGELLAKGIASAAVGVTMSAPQITLPATAMWSFIQPSTDEIAGNVGKEIFKQLKCIQDLKNDLLNKHEATRGQEQLQKLLLSPLQVLTPKFISSLITHSKNKPVALIFERYETATIINQGNYVLDVLNTWFYYLLDSLHSQFIKSIEKNDKEKDRRYNFCLIITSREKLTTTEYWKRWEEDYKGEKEEANRFREYPIPYFNESQIIDDYLKTKLDNEVYKELTREEKEKYVKMTCGHPGYLDSIYTQIKPGKHVDDSKINRDITEQFWSVLSREQRQVIQLVSCCRYFDNKIVDFCIQNLVSQEKEGIPHKFNWWFPWLKQQDFVSLENDRYHFDPLPRYLFRRSLFQEDKDEFYRSHQKLADYFHNKAANYLPEKPKFAKYNDSEWCEYIGEFLYHACFAQRDNFEAQFLYHLFASSYLNKEEVVDHSFRAINDEANFQDHPFLHDTTRTFLNTLKFVAKYSWAAFELDSETDNGKYKDKIAATVLLCKSRLKQQYKGIAIQDKGIQDGIGKVAILEFILKNLPVNCSQEERKTIEESLFKEIDKTADDSDPDFSSQLFMQSAFWQSGNIDNSLKWCNKAIEYKPNNANALYKKGLIFKNQAEEMLLQGLIFTNKAEEILQGLTVKEQAEKIPIENQKKLSALDKLLNALSSYNQALNIQPYDHRFWQARGDILSLLGKYFLSIEKQIFDLVNSHSSNYQNKSEFKNNSDCKDRRGTILQQAAYYLRASDSYKQAERFKPVDDNIKILQKESYKNYVQELNRCKDPYNKTNCSVKDNDKKPDEAERKKLDEAQKKLYKAVENNQLSEYLDEFNFSFLIDLGDLNRLNEDLEYQSESDQKNALTIAYRCYDRAICEQPEHPLGWYFRGLAQSELGQLNQSEHNKSEKELREAIKDFNKALEQKEDLSWAFYDRGIAHYRIAEIQPKMSNNQEDNEKKEYQNALKDFVQAIRINSEYDDAWYYRGLVLACMERYESAIASFDRTIQICQEKKQTKDEIKAWYDLGKCYKESGEQEEAIAGFMRAISVAEKHREKLKKEAEKAKVKAEEAKVKVEELKKEAEEAKAKAEAPPEASHVNSLFELGVIIYESPKYDDDEAIAKFKEVTKKFKEVTKLNPKHEQAWYYWGFVHYKLGELENDKDHFNKAIAKFEQVTKLNPKHIDSYCYWGKALVKLGRCREAIKYFEKVIKIADKKTQKDKQALGYCNLSNATYELSNLSGEDKKTLLNDALEYCEKAIDFNNELLDAHELLCKLLGYKERIYPDV